jgi:hypothetical protein
LARICPVPVENFALVVVDPIVSVMFDGVAIALEPIPTKANARLVATAPRMSPLAIFLVPPFIVVRAVRNKSMDRSRSWFLASRKQYGRVGLGIGREPPLQVRLPEVRSLTEGSAIIAVPLPTRWDS